MSHSRGVEPPSVRRGASPALVRPKRGNLTLSVASVILVLIAVEIGLRLYVPSLRLNPLVNESGPRDDEQIDRYARSSEAVEQRRMAYWQAVDVIGALEGHGLRLVLLAPELLFRAPALRCSDWFNADNPVCRRGLTIARADVERYRQPLMDSIAKLAKSYPDLVVWDTLDILCPDATCRAVTASGHPLFFDDNHLSAYANRILYRPFAAMLRRVLQEPAEQAPSTPRAAN